MKQALINFYLEFVNDFITVQRMAEYYGIDGKDAEALIEMGRKYHEENVELLKFQKQRKDELHANKDTQG